MWPRLHLETGGGLFLVKLVEILVTPLEFLHLFNELEVKYQHPQSLSFGKSTVNAIIIHDLDLDYYLVFA